MNNTCRINITIKHNDNDGDYGHEIIHYIGYNTPIPRTIIPIIPTTFVIFLSLRNSCIIISIMCIVPVCII